MAVHSRPTVLLTRPRAASERFAGGLHGVDVVIAPLMEIVGTGTAVALEDAAGVVLTSEAALPFVPRAPLPAYCVGPRTTAAAADAGFAAHDFGPNAPALVSRLLAGGVDGPLLHIRGVHQRGEVAASLTAGGLPTREVVAYDQVEMPPSADFYGAMAAENLLVPLFSPRSAALFVREAGKGAPTARLFAMSQAVGDAVPPEMRARMTIIDAPNGEKMRDALNAEAMRRNSL